MYKTEPSKNKRLRDRIGELRHRQFRDKIWHYGSRYVKGWYEKVKTFYKKGK